MAAALVATLIAADVAWTLVTRPHFSRTAAGACVAPNIALQKRTTTTASKTSTTASVGALPSFSEPEESPIKIHELDTVKVIPFGVASSEAYEAWAKSGDAGQWRLADIEGTWTSFAEPLDDARSGLAARVWKRHRDGGLDILIAFRGSADFDLKKGFQGLKDFANSWWANSLPVTGWLSNQGNQYVGAERYFDILRSRALTEADGAPLAFYVTGHSLGGGLAQHVALSFDCVTAVVFDTSPITGEQFFIQNPRTEAEIVSIFQRGERLSWFRKELFQWTKVDQRPSLKTLYTSVISADEIKPGFTYHSIYGMIGGMSRQALCCRTRRLTLCDGVTGHCDEGCDLTDLDLQPVHKLYCDTLRKDSFKDVACNGEKDKKEYNNDCAF